jgi:hypothetical protein
MNENMPVLGVGVGVAHIQGRSSSFPQHLS